MPPLRRISVDRLDQLWAADHGCWMSYNSGAIVTQLFCKKGIKVLLGFFSHIVDLTAYQISSNIMIAKIDRLTCIDQSWVSIFFSMPKMPCCLSLG